MLWWQRWDIRTISHSRVNYAPPEDRPAWDCRAGHRRACSTTSPAPSLPWRTTRSRTRLYCSVIEHCRMCEKRNEKRHDKLSWQFPVSKVSKFVQFGSERTVHNSSKTYVVGTSRGEDPHTRPRSAIHAIQALKSIPRGKESTHQSKIQVEIDLSKENAFVVLFFVSSDVKISNLRMRSGVSFWSLMRSQCSPRKTPHALLAI